MTSVPRPDHQLTVGDLFCGAGGFAEGFRQAGFAIKWGVDIWKPAVDTFQRNFPGSDARKADIAELNPASLEPVDVLIGSPPCVHFSPANRGGNGDRDEGMKLVRRYLEFVVALAPKYWIMENVPALRSDLDSEMDGAIFAQDGVRLEIPSIGVLDASEHSTPQTRRRLFSGKYPVPPKASDPASVSARTLGDVLKAFPDPALPPGVGTIADPVYPTLRLRAKSLRDHFEDPRWRLTAEEAYLTKARRYRDRIYGVMPFPDSIEKPARTITSTRTRASRSTMVVPYGGAGGFRSLTLRECASVQGFPLSYQFWADSMSAKDFLVGNAVPPPLGRSLAESILRAEGRQPPSQPLLSALPELPPILEYRRIGPRRFSMKRRFRGEVDVDWRRDHRVELDNELPVIRSRLPPDVMPPVTWRSRLYLGYATAYRCYELKAGDAIRLALAGTGGDAERLRRMTGLLLGVLTRATNGFPDGVRLQEAWSGWRPNYQGPFWLTALIARQVEEAFPAAEWSGTRIPAPLTTRLLAPCLRYRGSLADATQPIDASLRLLAAAIALAMYTERLNEGSGHLDRLHAAIITPKGLAAPKIRALAASLGPAGHETSVKRSVLIA